MNLRDWRKINRITQGQFGKMVGCQQSVISQWENGTPPNGGAIRAISIVTGGAVTFDDWFPPDEAGCLKPYTPPPVAADADDRAAA